MVSESNIIIDSDTRVRKRIKGLISQYGIQKEVGSTVTVLYIANCFKIECINKKFEIQ